MKLIEKTTILLVSLLLSTTMFAQMQTKSVGLNLRNADVTVANVHEFLNDNYSVGGAFTFEVTRDYVDCLGYRHTDFQQYYNDVPVEHAILIVHSLASKIITINGMVADVEQMPTKAVRQRVSPLQAVARAKQHLNVKADVRPEAEQVYTCIMGEDGSETYALVYKTRVTSMADATDQKVYLDVATGDVLKTIDMVQYAKPEIVEPELETYYSGKQKIRMTKYEDGSYGLADSVNGVYAYYGNTVKNDTLKYPLDNNDEQYAHIENMINKAVLRKAKKLEDWNIISIKGFNVDGFSEEHTSAGNLATREANYKLVVRNIDSTEFYASANTQFAYKTLPVTAEFEKAKTVMLDRDSSYIIDICIVKQEGLFLVDSTLVSFVFKADTDGNIPFPGDSVQGSLTVISQPDHALDAYWAMEKSYEYYRDRHKLNSFDNKGGKVHLFVDFDDPHFNKLTTNAWAWAAEPYFVATGIGDSFIDYLVADKMVGFDILVHEFTHLVVQNNGRGGLESLSEPGSINEAVSDCMAAACDFYTNGDRANWEIGEGVMGVPNMRDMKEPKMSGGGQASQMARPNPDTYNGEFFVDPSRINYDSGGMHINCGVFNFWFYLLSEGGEGVNDKDFSYKVEKIGIEKAADLLFYSIMNTITPAMKFRDAYKATVSAATLLWGETSKEYEQVLNAWKAVNVNENSEYVDVPVVIDPTECNVYTENGTLYVETESGVRVDVYTSVGQLVYSTTTRSSGATALPCQGVHGVVIVKVGNTVQKAII